MKISRKFIISVLALLSVWVLISKWHSLEEPLERDLTTYAYIAHNLIDGKELYSALWDHKPPGIFLIYMLAEAVGGYDQRSVMALGIVFTILSGIFLYLFLQRIADSSIALLGTAFWALASNSVALEANQPNVELFLNAFTLMGLWALSHCDGKNLRSIFMAGIFFAIAALFKTIIVFPVFFICLYYFFGLAQNWDWQGLRVSRRFIICFLAPAVLLWLGVFAYFGLHGRFASFWEAVFVFNKYYAGNIIYNIWIFFASPEKLFNQSLSEIWILVLLSLGWFCTKSKQYGQMKGTFFIFLVFGLCFEVASPGYGHPHYYQLLLPIFCILPALFCFDLLNKVDRSSLKYGRPAIVAMVVLSLVYLGYFQLRFVRMTPFQISQKKYGKLFTKSYEVANEVNKLTSPGDKIYEWGAETGIYYYSKRNSVTGIIYVHPLFMGPRSERTKKIKRVVEDVNHSLPVIFVYNERYGKLKKSIFQKLLKQNYVLVKKINPYYIFKKAPDTAGSTTLRKAGELNHGP